MPAISLLSGVAPEAIDGYAVIVVPFAGPIKVISNAGSSDDLHRLLVDVATQIAEQPAWRKPAAPD